MFFTTSRTTSTGSDIKHFATSPAFSLLCHSILCHLLLHNIKLSEPLRLHANGLLVQDISCRRPSPSSVEDHPPRRTNQPEQASLASLPWHTHMPLEPKLRVSACYDGLFRDHTALALFKAKASCQRPADL